MSRSSTSCAVASAVGSGPVSACSSPRPSSRPPRVSASTRWPPRTTASSSPGSTSSSDAKATSWVNDSPEGGPRSTCSGWSSTRTSSSTRAKKPSGCSNPTRSSRGRRPSVTRSPGASTSPTRRSSARTDPGARRRARYRRCHGADRGGPRFLRPRHPRAPRRHRPRGRALRRGARPRGAQPRQEAGDVRGGRPGPAHPGLAGRGRRARDGHGRRMDVGPAGRLLPAGRREGPGEGRAVRRGRRVRDPDGHHEPPPGRRRDGVPAARGIAGARVELAHPPGVVPRRRRHALRAEDRRGRPRGPLSVPGAAPRPDTPVATSTLGLDRARLVDRVFPREQPLRPARARPRAPAGRDARALARHRGARRDGGRSDRRPPGCGTADRRQARRPARGRPRVRARFSRRRGGVLALPHRHQRTDRGRFRRAVRV
ncbi:putative Uncharacterized 50.6 kDa protein in the 5'region of gyrA and gyrB [Curtobacterium sp. 8I-2]|nr:putative Uncharacterized 50.6 kDa protein in the 5'region of gyrA and gyrB [Curtobacterium sp. 8I-2]